jgi:hypothetical protein
MYSKLVKLIITTITILAVNLITSYISSYMISYKTHYKPLTYTLIGMGIMVLIFYPLFMKLEDWMNILSLKIVKTGLSMAGKYLGLLLAFGLSLSVLLYLYAKLWYKIDTLQLLFTGKITHYF